ncbi:MAG TPA: TldD/PmbA family protein [Nakamurella sp.]|nr:TldD/PmbA family protein [Nakamurella sp.]
MPHPIDESFTALPLRALADAALSAATAAGASFADFRYHRVQAGVLTVRDTAVQANTDAVTTGYAVRVIADGTWGFASSVLATPEAAAGTARQAVAVARALAGVVSERVERADEPVYRDATWVSEYEVDPFTVPATDKIGLLLHRSERLLAADGVSHTVASLQAAKENTFYADTAGTVTTQQRVRVQPELEAVAVDTGSGSFETMKSLVPPAGRGWEYVATGWDFDAEIGVIAGTLAEKLKAPSVRAGAYDLVIDPSNLFLTIHESIGHATEYDRAIGYEAAYAGTSFATPDQLGTLQYGSPVMHVTGDRTAVHGLATVGYDDDGVAAQSWDLVRDGVLVGYQLDRVFARKLGLPRSNGCAYADSPGHIPIQRMANVSLQPDPAGGSTEDLIAGVDDGIYVVGDKSWSIDMQRYNFQFTGQRFYRIRNGKLDGQLRDVAYQATTTDFWGAMDAVGGPDTYVLGGAFNCGKGQPGQVAAVSHGCPSARFRGINVLNAREEGGAA